MAIKINQSRTVQKLCQLAVQQKFADPIQLSIAYQTYLMMKIEAYQCAYALQHDSGRILLQDLKGDNDDLNAWGELDMPAARYQGQWVEYAANKVALFNEKGIFEGITEREESRLAPASWGGFIWVNNKAYQMSMMLNQMIPMAEVQKGPYDFVIPPNQTEGVFILDRAAGTLLMTDFTLNQTKAKLEVRTPGNKKAINLAYSAKHKRIYVTDHQTPDLLVINPSERSKDRIYTEHGVLGNIIVDDSRNLLYAVLVDTRKEPAILIFSQEDYSHQGTILLPGKLFSHLDDPCDLITISPSGKTLLVMTYTDQGALLTPMISLIDIESQKMVKSYTLSDEEKPIGLAFLKPEVKVSEVPSFDEVLLDRGVINDINLKNLVNQIQRIEEDRNKPLFDQDVQSAMEHIESHFSQEELAEVNHISEEAVNQMVQDSSFEWQGRSDMKQEEKQVFVERMAQLKADEAISQTNGVFVLNWLKGLNG